MGPGRQQCRHHRQSHRQPTSQQQTSNALCPWVAPALLVLLLSFNAAAPCAAQLESQSLCYWAEGMCSLNYAVYSRTDASSNQRLQQQLAELQQKTWRCIATGVAAQTSNGVWQQACNADQGEQCTTLPAADGGPTYCVASSAPEGLLKLLLGQNACALTSGSTYKPRQEWTPTYVASAVWWNMTCDTLNRSDVAKLLAGQQASWNTGPRYDEQAVLSALIDFDSSSKWCTSRASAESCAAGGLLPYVPALNTSCESETLHHFDGCCVNQDRADFSNQNLSGWLPDWFIPANEFTDLSNNPALCGAIALSRATATSAASMLAAPWNLYNSNVQVDLSDLGSWNGPMVARWLGDGALAFNNLDGRLSLQESYLMCVFMRTGQLTVAGSDACRPADGSSCSCKGSLAVMLQGSSQEWEACHRTALNVSFDSALHRAKAVAQYDQHMLGVEPAFACGRGGRQYRDKIAAVVWCVTGVVIVALGALAYVFRRRLHEWLYEDEQHLPQVAAAPPAVVKKHKLVHLAEYLVDMFGSQQQQKEPVQPPHLVAGGSGSTKHRQKHKWWAKALYLTSYIVLHSADVVMDWVYVYNVAHAGNLQVLLRLGWLLLAPYLVVQLMYAVCLLRFRDDSAASSIQQQWRQRPWRPVTAALLMLEVVVAVSLPAAATSRLLQYAGSSSFVSPADCVRMAWIFVACAVFSQLVLFFVGLLWKARSYLAYSQPVALRSRSQKASPGAAVNHTDERAYAVDSLAALGDLLFLLFEDVPQLVMQTWFWVSGMAMLPAWIYGVSTALSLLGLSFGSGHLALRVHDHGGPKRWAADVAAAWNLQLIVVPGDKL